MTLTVTQFPGNTTHHCATDPASCAIAGFGDESDSAETSRTFHFWRGASNRRYVHIVHGILECPEIRAANYVLVRVDAGGNRTPLRISRTTSSHGSENLAEIRFHAARLGANEIHLHVLADSQHAQSITQWDLEAAHFGNLVKDGQHETQRFRLNA